MLDKTIYKQILIKVEYNNRIWLFLVNINIFYVILTCQFVIWGIKYPETFFFENDIIMNI